MLPAVRSVPAGGSGECESATAWTGEKRRKTTCSSPLGSPDDATDMMGIQLQEGQDGGRGGGQRHPPQDDDSGLVYSVNDEISDEELDLCLRKVESRKPTIFLPTATRICNLVELEELYERFYQLQLEEYSKFKNSHDTNAPTAAMYHLDFHNWCHSRVIGWAINNEIFEVAGLSDYQRIIPTTSDMYDYKNWDEYCLILSDYETDEDYVKYCDELSKKIKWIEEYQHLDDTEFSKLKNRGFKQAMKIAAEFSHLPYSLAVRGYEEHVWYVRPSWFWKDLDYLYFEIWMRVTKQKMSFTQALVEIHAKNMFPSRSDLIGFQIQGATCFLSEQFAMCMKHIPKNVEVDAEVLQHINYVIHKLLKTKTYVHYVRKKLRIGKSLQMTPNWRKWPIEDETQFQHSTSSVVNT